MKILIVGGNYLYTAPLQSRLTAQGHSCACTGSSPADNIFLESDQVSLDTLLSDSWQVIHFNNTLPQGGQDGLRALKQRGARLILQLRSPLAPNSRLRDSGLSDLLPLFDRVLISSAEFAAIPAVHSHASWLAHEAWLELFDRPEPYEPHPQAVKILHVAHYTSPQDLERLESAIEETRARGLRFLFAKIDAADIPTPRMLFERIKECDLLIESLSFPCPGVLGIVAMSLGRTVLGLTIPEPGGIPPYYQGSPVVDCGGDSLASRINAIVREPKCLRDLGKRSRAHVESFHDASRVLESLLKIYSELAN